MGKVNVQEIRKSYADELLSKPEYILPNGRNSHEYAYSVKREEENALEALLNDDLDNVGLRWNGRSWAWVKCESCEE